MSPPYVKGALAPGLVICFHEMAVTNTEGREMRVDISTELGCSAAKAWDEVQKSALLLRVIRPMARISPLDGAFPERWREGLTIRCKLYIFGFIPIGAHILHVLKVDPSTFEILTHETDRLAKRWDHTISIAPLGAERALYRDVIDIEAGALTIVVWAFANCFYRYRQSRWRKIAPTL
jgi:hypothetical protein